jgi:CheY-like chemotaxis protein
MASILISDDEVNIVELLAMILSKAGYTVTTSASGSETLKALGIRPENASVELPDLIILDIMMPKLDGYSVAKLIKGHPRTRAIRILVLSGLREMSLLFTAAVQVEGFLRKPFSPEELLISVANILDHHKPASS